MRSECALIVTSIVLCVLIAMVSSAAAVEYVRVDSGVVGKNALYVVDKEVANTQFFPCDRLKEPFVINTGRTQNYAAPSHSGSLVHTISADVLGRSHIGFAAKDPHKPRHTIAIGRMETVGNFQIEKTFEIRSGCNQGSSGMWLGCP
ncbi:hypothetical protein C4E24_01915 [ANME-1 cluster archaeon AG-394-G21]|nr:hypothetical protein [ANME-1 cluster archaeon AG-394-G21]NAT10935.1 hypothetical protein [ANME-1 cluster archaeon AG-394-G06]